MSCHFIILCSISFLSLSDFFFLCFFPSCFFFSFFSHLCSYSAAVCMTPSDYNGEHKSESTSGQSCDDLLAHSKFTTTAQCTADPTSTEQGAPTWKQLTNHAASSYGCCGAGKKSACWEDVSAGICKTASDCTWSIALQSFFLLFIFRNSFSLLHTHCCFFFFGTCCPLYFAILPFPQIFHLIRLIKTLTVATRRSVMRGYRSWALPALLNALLTLLTREKEHHLGKQ